MNSTGRIWCWLKRCISKNGDLTPVIRLFVPGFEERFTFLFVLLKAHGPVEIRRIIRRIPGVGLKLQRTVNRFVEIACAGACRDRQTQAEKHQAPYLHGGLLPFSK